MPLKVLKPRLQGVGSKSVRNHPISRDKTRDAVQPWRAWYKTARWQRLRKKIILRDDMMCRATGQLLTGVHPAANSPVVDHIVPHRGDEALFWDPDNLQTVSKSYHDSEKQRQEKSGAF